MITVAVRGLTVGTGTPIGVERYPARLLSTAPIRVDDVERPHAHGATPGGDWLGVDVLAFELIARAADRAGALAQVAALRAAYAPAGVDEWLVVHLDGAEFHFRGRCNGADVALDRRYLSGTFPARVSFRATDPLTYGPEQSVVLTLADPGEGSVLPNVLPTVIGVSGGAGEASIDNTGNQPAEWTAVLDGPLVNPRLAHLGTGAFVRLLTTIGAGEQIDLDSEIAAVLIGNAVRNDLLSPGSSFFQLAGGLNTLRFTADSGTGTATITWRPGDA